MTIQKIRQLIKLLTELRNENFDVKISRDARGNGIQSVHIRSIDTKTFRASVSEMKTERASLIPKEEKQIFTVAPFTGNIYDLEYFLIQTLHT